MLFETEYKKLKDRLVPFLRFNQSIYEDIIRNHISANTKWLDTGCGHKILPEWRGSTERELVSKAKLVCGCDGDYDALKKHVSLQNLLLSNLEQLPFNDNSFNLITCNMVVEHLDKPTEVFKEFSRILKQNGILIIHTPNLFSYTTCITRAIPFWIRRQAAKFISGERQKEDFYPTRYRANTRGKLRRLLNKVGLEELRCYMLNSDASFQVFADKPFLKLILWLELIYIRNTFLPQLRFLRIAILGIYVKGKGVNGFQ